MKYIGVKVVEATPMTSGEAINLNYKTSSLRLDDPGYEVTYEGGYKSWSPADVFDKAHRSFGNLTFGMAVEALKQGKRVAREGWNGKGMFLYFVPGSKFIVNRPPLLGIYPEGTEVQYHAHIDMKTAAGDCVPWLASQTDVLAEDWTILE